MRSDPVGEELLDRPDAPAEIVRASLHHLARSNRWFGGVRAAVAGIRRLLPAGCTRFSLLDVGTGAGDIPTHLIRDFGHRGITVLPIGLDHHRVAARVAASHGIPSVAGDGHRLPFADRSIDVVMMSQLAHHFGQTGIISLAREASRVARIGVVISDLRRARWARFGFPIAGKLLGFDRVTIVDGVTSLDRGFRDGQLIGLLTMAGLMPVLSNHHVARIVATWKTPECAPSIE